MNCVSTISYSININGNMETPFKPSRGLRQGDSLSPFLFLICSEGFSSLMRLALKEGHLRGVKASRSRPQISHFLFTDDCVHFEETIVRSA